MNDLPAFDRGRHPDAVRSFISKVLSRGNDTALRDLIVYDDGHYRAVFDPAYFILVPERSEPSKSQWNTLKKRLKRMDNRVFVFKAHGQTDEGHYWLEFGFFKD